MPSSENLFYARPYSYSRGLEDSDPLFTYREFRFLAIWRRGLGYKREYGKPLSVYVNLDKYSSGSRNNGGVPEEGKSMWEFKPDLDLRAGAWPYVGLGFRLITSRSIHVLLCLYIACMYEALSHLLGAEYFLHAYGQIYALSADVVSGLDALRNNSFRMFSNVDVAIGSWMLARNAYPEDNKKPCETECTSSSIIMWDIRKCSGVSFW